MDVVLVMFKDDKRRDFPLQKPKTVIGRRQDCDLRIPTRDVSRRHCEIEITDDGVVVRDLGSTNGTYVNDQRIAEKKLDPGDRLTIGPVVFVVQIDGQPAEISAEDVAAAAAKAAAAPSVGEPGGEEDTEEILDLDDLELDLDEPIDIVESMLDEQDEEDESNKTSS